jgi:hypothetical protein
VAEFTPESTIRQVIEGHPYGRQVLWEYGYDVGEAFVDVLSQHQTLLDAARNGRLRNLDRLLDQLNQGKAGVGG